MGPHLEPKNTVLYFEPRGNGQSSKPADPTTMSAKTMAEDIEHLRKHLGLDVLPVLMGGSHAGAIVLRYAEVYPARVGKLVLFAAQIMDGPVNNNMEEWADKRRDDPGYNDAVVMLERMLAGREKLETDEEFRAAMDVLLPWYFSDLSKVDELRRHVADGPTLPGVYGFQTNFHDSKAENRLPHVAEAGRVEARTLVIYGEEDAMCFVGTGRAVADGIPGSRFVVVPGGHFAYIESGEVFFGEVQAFLES